MANFIFEKGWLVETFGSSSEDTLCTESNFRTAFGIYITVRFRLTPTTPRAAEEESPEDLANGEVDEVSEEFTFKTWSAYSN